MTLGPSVVNDPDDSEDETVAFDDVDPETDAPFEATPAQAVHLLRTALADRVGLSAPQPALAVAAFALRSGMEAGGKPHRFLRRAASWGDSLPPDDAELVVIATGAFIAMGDASGMPPAEEDRLKSLEAADWLGAVLGALRLGEGRSLTPSGLVDAIAECPEVDGEVAAADVERVEAAFELALGAWEATGVLDSGWHLTGLGVWTLPRALARAWGGGFDAPSPFDDQGTDAAAGLSAAPPPAPTASPGG